VYNYLWGIGLNEKKMCSGLARCKNACYIKMFVDFLAEGRREVKNNKNSKEYSGHELNVASQHRMPKMLSSSIFKFNKKSDRDFLLNLFHQASEIKKINNIPFV
jgi:hypothetical protein